MGNIARAATARQPISQQNMIGGKSDHFYNASFNNYIIDLLRDSYRYLFCVEHDTLFYREDHLVHLLFFDKTGSTVM